MEKSMVNKVRRLARRRASATAELEPVERWYCGSSSILDTTARRPPVFFGGPRNLPDLTSRLGDWLGCANRVTLR